VKAPVYQPHPWENPDPFVCVTVMHSSFVTAPTTMTSVNSVYHACKISPLEQWVLSPNITFDM